MGQNSKIEWCHHTMNPWWGCTKVSSGCANCYAETMAVRWGYEIWGDKGKRRFFGKPHWAEPLKWNADAERAGERRRVFCGSMCDVGEDRPEFISERIRLKRLIEDTPWLDWLLLSKRPENFLPLFYGPEWWPKNIWAGTSVENQAMADERIPHLLKVPATVRFLSVEPMLGAVDISGAHPGFPYQGSWTCEQLDKGAIHWVIVGGESGRGARPMNIEWARSVVAQSKAAGVPVFVKQLGKHVVIPHGTGNAHADAIAKKHGINLVEQHWQPDDAKGGDMNEWPEDLRVREFPTTTPESVQG